MDTHLSENFAFKTHVYQKTHSIPGICVNSGLRLFIAVIWKVWSA